MPWHRDGRYWPIKPLATTSVWIAVTDCTVDNGCLRAIPGSQAAQRIGRHFRDHSDRVTIPETLHADEFDVNDARDLELEAGQMAVFDVFMIHGSNPNPTAAPRTGYALRYMPAISHYDHHDLPIPDSRGSAHHTRPLILVRARDVLGAQRLHHRARAGGSDRRRWRVTGPAAWSALAAGPGRRAGLGRKPPPATAADATRFRPDVPHARPA